MYRYSLNSLLPSMQQLLSQQERDYRSSNSIAAIIGRVKNGISTRNLQRVAGAKNRLLDLDDMPKGIFSSEDLPEGKSFTSVDSYLYTEDRRPNTYTVRHTVKRELELFEEAISSDLNVDTDKALDRLYDEIGVNSMSVPEEVKSLWVVTSGGPISSGGGGAGTQPPPPFLAGGPWAATQFQGQTFRLEPVLEAGFLPARRPGVGGPLIEHPHRYATIHVIGIDGKVKLSTTDFSLSAVQKQIGEKFKLVSTFDGEHLVFQCEKGKVYQFNFKMLNSKSFDWLRAFELNWNRLFRGTQLASKQCRLYMLYSGTLVGGYPLAMSVSETAEGSPVTGMSISMYITDDVPLPRMTVLDRRAGTFTWQGENFRVGSGVDGRLATDSELPEGSKVMTPSSPEEIVVMGDITIGGSE